MSAADVRIAAARGDVEAKRQKLMQTLDELKVRLAPKTIAHDAWSGARDKGTEVADTTISAVKQRPAIAAGVAAGAALLLARKPLYSLITGLFSDADQDTPERIEPDKE